MASTKQHIVIGIVTGVLADLLKQFGQIKLDPNRPFNLAELAAYAIAGGAIGVIPDILEPATDPTHRRFFHSVFFGSSVLLATHGPRSLQWNAESRALLRM